MYKICKFKTQGGKEKRISLILLLLLCFRILNAQSTDTLFAQVLEKQLKEKFTYEKISIDSLKSLTFKYKDTCTSKHIVYAKLDDSTYFGDIFNVEPRYGSLNGFVVFLSEQQIVLTESGFIERESTEPVKPGYYRIFGKIALYDMKRRIIWSIEATCGNKMIGVGIYYSYSHLYTKDCAATGGGQTQLSKINNGKKFVQSPLDMLTVILFFKQHTIPLYTHLLKKTNSNIAHSYLLRKPTESTYLEISKLWNNSFMIKDIYQFILNNIFLFKYSHTGCAKIFINKTFIEFFPSFRTDLE